MLRISHDSEAGETWSRLVSSLKTYTVKITPEDGSEPFDAVLVGVDYDASWYGTVKVKRLKDDLTTGDTFSVVAAEIHVY